MNNVSSNANKNAKTKRKFNIIDFFILLIILSVIAALIYVFSPWSKLQGLLNANEVTLGYKIELKEVDDEFINLINQGDGVINLVTKNSLGTVVRVESISKSTKLDYIL